MNQGKDQDTITIDAVVDVVRLETESSQICCKLIDSLPNQRKVRQKFKDTLEAFRIGLGLIGAELLMAPKKEVLKSRSSMFC